MGFLSAKSRETLGLNVYHQDRDLDLKPTAGQTAVVDGVTDWLKDPEAIPYARLVGPAGTGKSASLGLIVREICRNKIKGFHHQGLVLAAPTHKAGREAEGKLIGFGITLEFQTTCRLLCLEESFGPKGEQIFVQTRLPNFASSSSFFIIDECSLMGEYQINCLENAITDLCHKRQAESNLAPAKVLVVGDDRQLTPVNEGLNNLFKAEIPEFRLSEIVRHTGPVLEQSIATRATTVGRPKYRTVGDGSEVWVTRSKQKFEDAYIKALKAAHKDKDYNRVVAVASRNKRVEQLCDLARTALYGAHATPFQLGERLLSKTALKRFGVVGHAGILCHSTTEMVVLGRSFDAPDAGFLLDLPMAFGGSYSMSLRHIRHCLLLDKPLSTEVSNSQLLAEDEGLPVPRFRCYKVNAELPDIPDVDGCPLKINFHSVVPEEKKAFTKFSNRFRKLIRDCSEIPDQRKKDIWGKFFYPYMALNADVQSAMALTIHRSQGSTIPEVFVDFDNIDRTLRRQRFDHNRAAYTAITRASKFLGILDPTNTEELA